MFCFPPSLSFSLKGHQNSVEPHVYCCWRIVDACLKDFFLFSPLFFPPAPSSVKFQYISLLQSSVQQKSDFGIVSNIPDWMCHSVTCEPFGTSYLESRCFVVSNSMYLYHCKKVWEFIFNQGSELLLWVLFRWACYSGASPASDFSDVILKRIYKALTPNVSLKHTVQKQ